MIELMIVVAIIGILAAVAIPNYDSFRKRAKTVEAKTMLKALAVLEEAYRAEHDVYTDDVVALGFGTTGKNYFSQPIFVGPTFMTFTAQVSGNIDLDPDLDIWSINDNLAVTHIQID